MRTLAIIPARGGSKRIPGKNIRPFYGKPIITYPIKAALKSRLFDKVIVSTDSKEIADISRQVGADIPFMRPAALSGNHVNLVDVAVHTIQQIIIQGFNPEYVCLIIPVSAFLRPEWLEQSFEQVKSDSVDNVVSVLRFPSPVLRHFVIGKEGFISMKWPEYKFAHSNNMEDCYYDAGQFYWMTVNRFLKSRDFFSKKTCSFILPEWSAVDIDTEEDWEMAEIKYKICEERGLFDPF